eukprot:1549002-Alexandrium_andersonii.AAC.1
MGSRAGGGSSSSSSSSWSALGAAPCGHHLSGPTDELTAIAGGAVGEFNDPAVEVNDMERSSFDVLCQINKDRAR